MRALLEPLPVKLVPLDDQGRMRDYQMPKLDEAASWNLGSNLDFDIHLTSSSARESRPEGDI